MPQRRAIVRSANGLHARPATLVTQAVAESGHAVTIARVGQAPVDADSILSMMSLGLVSGDEVILESEHPDAQDTLDRVAEIIETDLDSATPTA